MKSLNTAQGFLPFNFGLEIEQIAISPETSTLVVKSTAATAACPLCAQPSDRIHSRYQRKLADLPWQGKIVTIRLQARRFFCPTATCNRKVFVERVPKLARAYARSTVRLSQAHSQIGLALGGEAGARLTKQLAMPTSPDTLLRRVKQCPMEPAPLPRIVGIDEWAWRKGRRYGTVLVDLERHRVFDLLPDHESQTLQSWLKQQPQIEVISRDRSGTIAQAASVAAPQAKQVADRWHLLKNLREAVERIFQRCSSGIQDALGRLQQATTSAKPASTETPNGAGASLKMEQSQETGPAHRVERFERVRQMHKDGYSNQRIARVIGISRKTVGRYLRREQCPNWHPGRTRPVRLDGFRESVDRRLHAGCRNAALLHRELTNEGYQVSYHAVRRFVRRHLLSLGKPRAADRALDAKPCVPSARELAFSLLRRPDDREAQERAQLQAVGEVSAELKGALALVEEFAAMTRKTLTQSLPTWLEKADHSTCKEMHGMARSLRQDEAAVAAALSETWSNGPVEGAINRLKAIKRQMYGRAGFELLRARVLNAA